MKKILSVLILLIAFQPMAWATDVNTPLPQRQWFSISAEGANPRTYTELGGLFTAEYVLNTGLQKTVNGNMCFAQADASCSAFTAPGPGAIWEVRIRDGDGATLGDVNLMNVDPIPATDYGLNVLSGTYGFDGTNFIPITGTASLADDVASTTNPLATQGFVYGYDRTNDNWDRVDAIVAPAAMDTVQYGLVTYNGNYFWNLSDAEFARWDGDDMDQEVVATTAAAPYSMSFNYGYDPDNAEWKWMHVLATLPATMATTMNPLVTAGATYGYDGTAAEFVRIISEDGAVDNMATTDDGLLVNNRAFYYDSTGTNWDRQQGEDGYAYVQDKAYTSATNSNRTQEINPLSEHYEFAELADVTDGADAAVYYYVDMTGKRASAYQLSLDCDAGTVTATIECTLEDDCAPAACTYIDVTTLITTGALVSTAAPASALWGDNDHKLGSCKYTRVKIDPVTGATTGDWKVSTEKHY